MDINWIVRWKGEPINKFSISQYLYPPSRRPDGDNIQKILIDSLVESKVLVNDNFNHMLGNQWEFVEVDKINPRVVLFIKIL